MLQVNCYNVNYTYDIRKYNHRTKTYIVTLTTTEEQSKQFVLAWLLEYRNLVIVAFRRITTAVHCSVELLQICHFRRIRWRRHPSNKLRVRPTLPRVVRKEHDSAIELFITINPLVKVASIKRTIRIGGGAMPKLTTKKSTTCGQRMP
jgi:hypothetical protein